jgi:hypothetical protein
MDTTCVQLSHNQVAKELEVASLIRRQASHHKTDRNLDQALGRIFPTSKEETLIQRVRQSMGSQVSNVTDEELEKYLTELQSLVGHWFDLYEQQIFGGQTLQQVLRKD